MNGTQNTPIFPSSNVQNRADMIAIFTCQKQRVDSRSRLLRDCFYASSTAERRSRYVAIPGTQTSTRQITWFLAEGQGGRKKQPRWKWTSMEVQSHTVSYPGSGTFTPQKFLVNALGLGPYSRNRGIHAAKNLESLLIPTPLLFCPRKEIRRSHFTKTRSKSSISSRRMKAENSRLP